jgi:hypothetical protein
VFSEKQGKGGEIMKKIITATAVIAASLFATWYWRFRKRKSKEEGLAAENVEAISRSEVP